MFGGPGQGLIESQLISTWHGVLEDAWMSNCGIVNGSGRDTRGSLHVIEIVDATVMMHNEEH